MRAEAGDIALVRRVQKGDKAAFDALVLKYQHKVLKLVQRYVRNPAEAEDIAQEAFIKAYRALPAFRGDSAFYTWLYRIAINTAKNALVASRRRPVSYDLDLQDGSQVQAQARLAIVLRELEGLSYEDIAKTMECPVGTVRSRIFRAREAIDRSLREVFDGGLGRIGDIE
jgi:RNA polymerase sigma-70 factor (ECF subfamily)